MSLRNEISSKLKPGDDFYNFVNQKWRDSNPIPEDKARYDSFTVLTDENMERLHGLLESPARSNGAINLKRLRDFYHSAMDETAITKAGLSPIRPQLDEIDRLSDAAAIADFLGKRQAQGLGLVWHLEIEPDDKDSSRYLLRFFQAGLGMPDRDYYFEKGERFDLIRQQYQKFLTDLFKLLRSPDPKGRAAQVFNLETELAKASKTATEQRDADAMYNLYPLKQLTAEMPAINWPAYFKKIGLADLKNVVISQPEFIKRALVLLSEQPIEAWRSYLAFHSLAPLLSKLPPEFDKLQFDFYGRVLEGAKQPEPRYRRVIRLTQMVLPEPMGQLFVESYFDETAKQAIYDLVKHLQLACRNRIEQLPWMSQATKRKALAKLETFLPLLGYPDKWRDYSQLDTTGSYAANFVNAHQINWRYTISRINHPVDRTEWLMSPALVNACYWSNTNSITFPAGILQPPFFDARGDFAANYGAIGVVIGHEITHGFDDEGSKFDKNGNLNSWWTQADRQAFEKRAKQLEKQYSRYQIDGRNVNGKLTLGENIADLGGSLIAFDALKQKLAETGQNKKIDGFTPEQRFFMGFARVWRQNIRPELSLRFLVADPHSPDVYRTNGTVTNCDPFYEAFEVSPKDQLYQSEKQRVRIW